MLTDLTPPAPDNPDEQPTQPALRTIRAADTAGVFPRSPSLTTETYARLIDFALDQGRQAIRRDGEMGAFAEVSVIPQEHLAALRALYEGGYVVEAYTAINRRSCQMKLWSNW